MRAALVFCGLLSFSLLAQAAPQGASVAVDPKSGQVWVAEHDGDKLVVSDAGAAHLLRTIPLAGAPQQVLVSAGGDAFASLPDRGLVARVGKGEPEYSRVLGREPHGLAMTPDGKTLYVTLAGDAQLVELDAATLVERQRIEVAIEPRAIVVSDDGQRAAITHLVGHDVTVVQLTGEHGLPRYGQRLVPLASSEHGHPDVALAIAIDPRFGHYYVPHELADTDDRGGGTYGGRSGPPIEAAVSVVDAGLGDAKLVESRATQEIFHPRGDPRCSDELSQPSAVALDVAGGRLFIAGLGSDAIPALNALVTPGGQRFCVRLPRDSGPSGLATSPDGQWLYAYLSFRHELAAARLPSYANEPFEVRPRLLRTGTEPLSAELVRGRRLFYAAGNLRQSADGALPCGCCHPGGRQDGRVWKIDGMPRQTPILAGRLDGTGPYNWLGSKKTLRDNMQETVNRLGGTGLGRAALADLEAYVRHGMRAPPPVDAGVQLVAEGRRLFNDGAQGCAHCHDPSRGFTDGKRHTLVVPSEEDLLLATMRGEKLAYKTPSLIGVSRGAPYLHDGSVATLRELLSWWNEDDRMGRTTQLSPGELDALLAYLDTL